MIYLVDNTIDGQGASPREIKSALERVKPDLKILVEPFHKVSLSRLDVLSPSHIILSGQSHPWEMYAPESLAGLYDVIRKAPIPILGVCGGHQQMGLAFGAAVGLMERLTPGEGYNGAKRERGFLPVQTLPVEGDSEVLFRKLPSTFTVWHSHCDEVKELPPGFRRTAFNDTCAIQAMQHESMPLFGVQFHPELFDEVHPQGRLVIENFLDLS
ncbi:MAG: synthase family protein [Acidobacteria bacterium]|nr:synthase family protein [Acidobacteriota bacterium]